MPDASLSSYTNKNAIVVAFAVSLALYSYTISMGKSRL